MKILDNQINFQERETDPWVIEITEIKDAECKITGNNMFKKVYS